MSEIIASVFLDSPSWYDHIFRRVGYGEPVYVTEYQYSMYDPYGGRDQRRHQRRYKELRHAVRRLNFLIATQLEIDKAYILGMPLDVKDVREKTRQQDAMCTACGGHEWKFDRRRAAKRKDCL